MAMIAMKDLVNKIISMYAKGMTTRQISKTIEDIYGFEVSEGMVSDITDKLLPRIEEAPSPSARSMGICSINQRNFTGKSDNLHLMFFYIIQ